MRDPVFRIDPDEAAIEATCRVLAGYMKSRSWKADPPGRFAELRAAIHHVEASNLPGLTKIHATVALFEQMKKRRGRGKPTRHSRDVAIRLTAIRLVLQGYKPTRNDVTRDRESASSIVHQALRRLSEKDLSEKSINAIIAKSCREALKDPANAAVLRRVLK